MTDEFVKNTGLGFAAFLRREMSCNASVCRWQWWRKGNDHYVWCKACGSLYPWRDTYYLRRIYELEAEREKPVEHRNAEQPITAFDKYLHDRARVNVGKWKYYRCWKCDDGRNPDRCPSPDGVCEYPRAVND